MRLYLKEFNSNMIISAITYLSYGATYGRLSVLRLVTEKFIQEDCSGVMVDKHTRRKAANTDGVHNHSRKRKKAAISVLCLAFFLNLSAQTVSAWAEAAEKQTQDIQTADEQTENNQTENNQTVNNQIENSQAGDNQTGNGQTEEKHAVTFSELNDEEVFLKQSQARVCTLAASTMMIRRAAMLSGNTDWRQITEKSVRKYAWAEKTGLKWNFTAAGISVAHKTLASKNELIQLLGKHPEGIVIYNSRKPHAILVTDYTNGILYCSDPSNDKPSGRYPITQASITAESAGRCWYVKHPVDLTVVKTDEQQSEQAVNGLLYRVLDQEKKTAVCTGRIAEDTVVTVPETVMLNGMEYQVVQIAEGAFADSGKLKEITIGANVAEIEPKAFFQCKKLQKVTIHADNLKKIGTDAFGKIHKKARILIIGEQMETFAALLSGTAVPVTATIGAGKQ